MIAAGEFKRPIFESPLDGMDSARMLHLEAEACPTETLVQCHEFLRIWRQRENKMLFVFVRLAFQNLPASTSDDGVMGFQLDSHPRARINRNFVIQEMIPI